MVYSFYLISVHFFSVICITTVTSLFLFPFFLLCFAISFLYYFFRVDEIITLQYSKKTEWILELRDGRIERAELLPSSVMMHYFLVLHFKCFTSSEKKTIVLFSDSFVKKDYQALRRCVRMGYW
ncbi:MAG: hypothetical protein A3E53_04875 [Gammaproteobacteria bacterium RIFCSPHIGHO2_12_FULL_39_24]|nr:MAG: hypothetical protein A3E53_04875 [Gammaproteobacteria bacterium RIFCSPHIGHO2_12_FULL_39_24]